MERKLRKQWEGPKKNTRKSQKEQDTYARNRKEERANKQSPAVTSPAPETHVTVVFSPVSSLGCALAMALWGLSISCLFELHHLTCFSRWGWRDSVSITHHTNPSVSLSWALSLPRKESCVNFSTARCERHSILNLGSEAEVLTCWRLLRNIWWNKWISFYNTEFWGGFPCSVTIAKTNRIVKLRNICLRCLQCLLSYLKD